MEWWTETKHKPNTEVRVQNAPWTQSLRVKVLHLEPHRSMSTWICLRDAFKKISTSLLEVKNIFIHNPTSVTF